jgi:hypothetical protein
MHYIWPRLFQHLIETGKIARNFMLLLKTSPLCLVQITDGFYPNPRTIQTPQCGHVWRGDDSGAHQRYAHFRASRLNSCHTSQFRMELLPGLNCRIQAKMPVWWLVSVSRKKAAA